MLGSTVLEVAIGLALLFALLSLVVTSAREALETLLQTRAIHLERGMRELLQDKDGTKLAKLVYDHPYINSLYLGTYSPASQLRDSWKIVQWWKSLWGASDNWKRVKFRSALPAYIPRRNFALALLDAAARGRPSGYDVAAEPLTFERLRQGVAQLPSAGVRRALMVALEDARGDMERARENVEKWFDSGMDRVSGWYRKQTQWILLALGLATAVFFNVDTLRIASALYNDNSMRAVIVKEAEVMSSAATSENSADAERRPPPVCEGAPGKSSSGAARSASDCAQARLSALGYPIGWDNYRIRLADDKLSLKSWKDAFDRSAFPWDSIPGWLITALALSLGAPFWFDLLNKMMVIRSTVKPHEKSPEESSEDRQKPAATASAPAPVSPPPPVKPEEGKKAPDDAAPKPPPAAEDPDFKPHEWRSGDKQEGDL